MKTLLIILFLSQTAFAQDSYNKISIKEVEKETRNPKSKYYYSELMRRFDAFDTTLTPEDYRMIYFGFVFNEKYSAFPEDKSKEIRTQIDSGNFDNAIKLCDSVLQNIPVFLRANYLKGYCLFKINKEDSLAKKYFNRYFYLTDAIISTGNGLTCKSGFKVIFIADEYEVIYNYFEVEGFSGQSLSSPCDILHIEPSDKFRYKDIYFDADEILKKEAEMFK